MSQLSIDHISFDESDQEVEIHKQVNENKAAPWL